MSDQNIIPNYPVHTVHCFPAQRLSSSPLLARYQIQPCSDKLSRMVAANGGMQILGTWAYADWARGDQDPMQVLVQ